MNNTRMVATVALAALSLVIGAALEHHLMEGQGTPSPVAATGDTGKPMGLSETRRILYWASPMDPSVHSDHPMKDSMHMAYVPVYAPTGGGASQGPASTPAGLSVSPQMAQALGVRVTAAVVKTLGNRVTAPGVVAIDDRRLMEVSARTSGWIQTLSARTVGVTVARGEVLATLYAPALYGAEREYLIATQSERGMFGAALVRASAEKLTRLGLTADDIDALRRSRRARPVFAIRAPESGTVLAVGVRQGGRVTSGVRLFEIADLGRVWVKASIYPSEMPWVRVGDHAIVTVRSDQAIKRVGIVDFIYPTANPDSRSFTARLTLSNRDGQLRPGMYVGIVLHGPGRRLLAVPSDAVLRGAHGAYVMVATGGGHYAPAEVALGPADGGDIGILGGLKPGDEVVSNAQFMLYAESRVEGLTARLKGPGGPGPADTATGSAP